MANDADHNLKELMKPTADCLDLDTIALLVEDEDGADPVSRRHVRECPRCQAESELLKAFLKAEPGETERPGVDAIVHKLRTRRIRPERRWVRRLTAPWAWGPALAAAALVLVVLVNTGRERLDEVNLQPGTTVLRSQAITVVQPVGEMAELPRTIEWKPVSGAAQYRVRLSETDRTVVWENKTRATNVELPRNINYAPGRWLACEVEATDVNGTSIAHSGAIKFRLAPR